MGLKQPAGADAPYWPGPGDPAYRSAGSLPFLDVAYAERANASGLRWASTQAWNISTDHN
jgi:hypothetical protein